MVKTANKKILFIMLSFVSSAFAMSLEKINTDLVATEQLRALQNAKTPVDILNCLESHKQGQWIYGECIERFMAPRIYQASQEELYYLAQFLLKPIAYWQKDTPWSILVTYAQGAHMRYTALACAAITGDATAAFILLHYGAQVDELDEGGCTALRYVAGWGNARMVDMLVKAGANVNAASKNDDITPLIAAVESGSQASVELLLRAGADVGKADKHYRNTALHVACQSGSMEIIAQLLKAGAPTDCVNLRLATPLKWAQLHVPTSAFPRIRQLFNKAKL